MEAERPRPPSDAELEAELERLSREAQSTLDAEREQLAADRKARGEVAPALGETEASEGLGFGAKLAVGGLALVGLLVLWGLVIRPLLGLAIVVGVVALLGFGVWKLVELGGAKDEVDAP